jgi:hypothetical protein
MIMARMAVVIFCITRVSRNLSAKKRIKILITKLKSPRVKKIIGREISVIIGLIKALISPIIIPAIKRSMVDPVKINPGRYLSANKIARQLAIIRSNNLIKLIIV